MISPISPSEVFMATEILAWARDYLMQPHGQLGRGGEVCPFVKPSVENDSFYIDFQPYFNHKGLSHIVERMLEYPKVFKQLPPYEERDLLRKALVVVGRNPVLPNC